MIYGIDFDGTCVKFAFPLVGEDIGAAPVLKALVERGDRLVLWTVRDSNYLVDAVQWFEDKDIPLWGINRNPDQWKWNGSPKAHCNVFIDDAALGVPLIEPGNDERPYVDWEKVAEMLGVEL